jgi:pilus assembly protein Flp/PilA
MPQVTSGNMSERGVILRLCNSHLSGICAAGAAPYAQRNASPLPGVLHKPTNKDDNPMKQLMRNLISDESGQDLIEYALVAALVGLGAVASMNSLANSIGNTFNGVGNALTNAVA